MSNAEKWKAIDFPKKVKLQKKYLVSNTGKLASYADSPKNAQKLKAKRIEDYHCISIRMFGVKKITFRTPFGGRGIFTSANTKT
ncbi:MAG: hypothetical protein IPJ32_18220 [Sphingobacteriaceae bacterium]|nr:hypothetical protein [Sphingobacteriaceae bacterium]